MAKTETQKEEIYEAKKSYKNAIILYDNRSAMINAFITRDILPEDVEEEVYFEEKPEYEESIAERTKRRRQNQEGQGLKILTPQQMLNRLPISLARLKAGNNSQKFKNEIRQLLYSLYRSKNYPKKSIVI